MKHGIVSAIAVALFTLGLLAHAGAQTAAPRKSKIPAALKSQAKISVDEARATALKMAPGEIKEEELEKEHGKLVYSFDIQKQGRKDITEVQVNAIDGSIVSLVKESAASETKEKKRDSAHPQP